MASDDDAGGVVCREVDDDNNDEDDGGVVSENDEAGGGVVRMNRSPSVMEERDVNDVSDDATPMLLLLGLKVSTASSANAVFMAAVSH